MTRQNFTIGVGAFLGSLLLTITSAQALTIKECGAKYRAAQTAGTLNGMKWNDFRRTECGAAASAVAPVTTTGTGRTSTIRDNAVYPAAISEKYTGEATGKARMHTCLDQYNANKAANGNAGLKWIQKGGGYYSECNKRLKG